MSVGVGGGRKRSEHNLAKLQSSSSEKVKMNSPFNPRYWGRDGGCMYLENPSLGTTLNLKGEMFHETDLKKGEGYNFSFCIQYTSYFSHVCYKL